LHRAWLTVLLPKPAYHKFRLAVRYRLGMLPYGGLWEEYFSACHRRDSIIPLCMLVCV